MNHKAANEFKFIKLLSRDSLNSHLNKINKELELLDPTPPANNNAFQATRLAIDAFKNTSINTHENTPDQKTNTEAAWAKLITSLNENTGAEASRLKKIARIEAKWSQAEIYQKFDDTLTYRKCMYKINKLIKLLLIEYTLLEIPVPTALFSNDKLNKIVRNLSSNKHPSKQPV